MRAFYTLALGFSLTLLPICSLGAMGTLSGKAAAIIPGADRTSVLKALGRATWAALPEDDGDFKISGSGVALVLYWNNAPCSPVTVSFDKAWRVLGVDEGRGVCGKDVQTYALEPSDQYSCARPDRQKICS